MASSCSCGNDLEFSAHGRIIRTIPDYNLKTSAITREDYEFSILGSGHNLAAGGPGLSLMASVIAMRSIAEARCNESMAF